MKPMTMSRIHFRLFKYFFPCCALFFLLLQQGLACPPCPTGASTSGRGVTTTSAVCRCDSLTDIWNGTSCSAPSNCASATKTWLTNCSASVPTTANGASATVTNTALGYTGSATFSCSSGTWGAPTGTSCSAAASCPGGVKSWLTNCSANVPTTASGASATVTNTAPGYTGTATRPCVNGVWGAPTSESCTSL